MSNRKAEMGSAARTRWRALGLGGPALAALLAFAWTGATGAARADAIVLKSGEVLEGSIIDATRNTVVVRRAIGGMRQMPLREIAEVRIDLARGQRISGQLLSWADGVYEVRAGGETLRVSAGDILSREAGEAAAGQPTRDPPARPVGPQTVRRDAGPATAMAEESTAEQAAPARGQIAAPRPAAEPGSPAAGEQQSAAAAEQPSPSPGDAQNAAAAEQPSPGEEQSAAAAEQPSPAAGKQQDAAASEAPQVAGEQQSSAAADEQGTGATEQSMAAADEEPGLAAGEEQSATVAEEQRPAPDEEQNAAAGEQQSPGTGEEQSGAALDQNESQGSGTEESLVAVKAFVAPAEPGADQLVFRIELSRPAEQTVVLIYGTVEGTAKAGEDFEPKQGMVTLAPGTKSASVLVPLIERPPGQGEKRFELFLTADPKVAEIVDHRVVATINDGAD